MNDYGRKEYAAGANGLQAPLIDNPMGPGPAEMSITIFATSVGQKAIGKVYATLSTTDEAWAQVGTFSITAESTTTTKPEGETYRFPSSWRGRNFRVSFDSATEARTLVIASSAR